MTGAAEEDRFRRQTATRSQKTPEEKLNDLIEKGKKAGKLTTKDLEGLEQWGLDPEAIDKFYEALEAAGVDIDIADDELPPVDDDDLPALEELEEIEEVTEEEIPTPTRWPTPSPPTTPCACISRR
jgi:hypothetical protein